MWQVIPNAAAAVIAGGLPASGSFVSVYHSGLLREAAGRNSSKVWEGWQRPWWVLLSGSSSDGGTWPLSTKLTSLVDLAGRRDSQEGNRTGISRTGKLC